MTISDKLTTIAENVQKVYNTGYDKATDEFWDFFQKYGNRTTYNNSFNGAAFKVLSPKYGFDNATNCGYMCSDCRGMTEVNVGNATKCTNWNYAFNACHELTYIRGHIAFKGTTHMMFYVTSIKEIESIDASGATSSLAQTFYNLDKLEQIKFIGNIPLSISFSACKKLTHDSLMSIINALKDYSEDTSGTTYTLTIGTTNIEKLTNEELDIGRNKGWVIK